MLASVWSLQSKKAKKVAALAIISTFLMLLGYAFGLYTQPPTEEQVIKGTVAFALDVYNVEDLFAWQAIIAYNPQELKVLKIIPGEFVGTNYPLPEDFSSDSIFVNSTDSFEDAVIIGGCLIRGNKGKSGSGRLALVIFGYFEESYSKPYVIPRKWGFKSMLLDSAAMEISFTLNPENLSDGATALVWVEVPK